MDHSTCTHSGTRRAIAACEAAAAPAPAAVEMTSFNKYRTETNTRVAKLHNQTTAYLQGRLSDYSDTRPTEWHIG